MAAFLDVLNYGISTTNSLISTTAKSLGLNPKKTVIASTQAVDFSKLSLSQIAGKDYAFVRLAGILGASAVVMGAYGKYNLAVIGDPKKQMEAKNIFDTANRFHFLHSIAMIGMPLAKRTAFTGSLMAFGTVLFSGQMYYRALTGNKTYVHISTLGGFCLILAWLSLIF